MVDPLFWLGLSILLVAVSLTAVLVAALPALRELSRAARSAEKLFETLNRELPPTLESIRLTGMELTDLTEDLSEGVQSAGRVAQQLDQSITGVKRQAKQAQVATRSIFAGVRAAWKTLNRPTPVRRSREAQSLPRSPSSPDVRNALTADAREPLNERSNRFPVANNRSTFEAELESVELEGNQLDDSRNSPKSHADRSLND
ncbi:hypothetical protein [Egbenema bharatensis]|uniref:hypothetical protein n=1 Tax=Egbenema bharatensis TaxID=3463334 RepID=UPI003A84008F